MAYRGFVIMLIGILLLSAVAVIGRVESSEGQDKAQLAWQEDATPTPEPDEHHAEDEHVEDDHMDDNHMDDDHMSDDHETEYTPEMIMAGQQLFTQFACFACHGPNGEGTDLAPALAGHSPESIQRQVRMPTSNMPVFPPATLTAENVDMLVAFISSLEADENGGEHAHMHAGNTLGDLMVEHHALAYEALVDENYEEAIHQVKHIIEITTGPHQLIMQTTLEQLENGEYDLAFATLADMLYGIKFESVDTHIAHLQMALAWIIAENADNALHHLEHVIDYSDDEHLQENVEIIIGYIEIEEWQEAQDTLLHLLPESDHEHEDGEADHHEDENESEHEEAGDHHEETEHEETLHTN